MLSVPTQNLSVKMHRNVNLVQNCLYDHFPESMLSVPTQILSAKMHRNANLVRNCLYDHFPESMLSVLENLRNAKIFALHYSPCAKFALVL